MQLRSQQADTSLTSASACRAIRPLLAVRTVHGALGLLVLLALPVSGFAQQSGNSPAETNDTLKSLLKSPLDSSGTAAPNASASPSAPHAAAPKTSARTGQSHRDRTAEKEARHRRWLHLQQVEQERQAQAARRAKQEAAERAAKQAKEAQLAKQTHEAHLAKLAKIAAAKKAKAAKAAKAKATLPGKAVAANGSSSTPRATASGTPMNAAPTGNREQGTAEGEKGRKGEGESPITQLPNHPITQSPEHPTPDTRHPVSGTLATQTKPDIFPTANVNAPSGSHTQDNPLSAVGDSWKMLLYLVPMLLLTMGALHLLRRFYERNGRLPALVQTAGARLGRSQGNMSAPRLTSPLGGLRNSLLGGFHFNNARQHGGSNIRLVESVPVGGANLHLIEVRGRLLLVGATNAGVSLLTEFDEPQGFEAGDFRALLQAAAADMDSLDLAEPDLPATAMVGSLEDAMRETSDSLARRARRLRTVQEEEDAVDVGEEV